MITKKALLGRMVARVALGLLIGTVSVVGLLILLSEETSARPLLQTAPDLILSVDHDPILFSPQGRMTYTISYHNKPDSDTPESAVITATVPEATEYVDIGYDWQAAGSGVYTYSVPPDRLDPGTAVYLVHFVVRNTNSIQIAVEQFNSTFTIAAGSGVDSDANPDDNVADVTIGVPDLKVTDVTVEPFPLQANVPVTFTVVMQNQGPGIADDLTNEGGGSFVGIYLEPVSSYPCEFVGDFYDYLDPIPPGAIYTSTVALTSPGGDPIQFTEQQVRDLDELYAKADSHPLNPYGLIPEYDEFNNVGTLDLRPYDVYLPLAVRNW